MARKKDRFGLVLVIVITAVLVSVILGVLYSARRQGLVDWRGIPNLANPGDIIKPEPRR